MQLKTTLALDLIALLPAMFSSLLYVNAYACLQG